MIDGLFKKHIDPLWDRVAKTVVAMGLTPNEVTWTGLAGVALASALYPLWPNPPVFGIVLALFFAFDSLDGAVARLRNMGSYYGGYLDAMADRYQEVFVFAALAVAHDCWAAAFFALSGGLLVSYAKARTAIERPIDNAAWPDLMERLERVILLCAGLLIAPLVPWPDDWPGSFVAALLIVLGALSHLTAVQRFRRARRILKGETDDADGEG